MCVFSLDGFLVSSFNKQYHVSIYQEARWCVFSLMQTQRAIWRGSAFCITIFIVQNTQLPLDKSEFKENVQEAMVLLDSSHLITFPAFTQSFTSHPFQSTLLRRRGGKLYFKGEGRALSGKTRVLEFHLSVFISMQCSFSLDTGSCDCIRYFIF